MYTIHQSNRESRIGLIQQGTKAPWNGRQWVLRMEVAFEKAAEMTWDTVVVTDSGHKIEQHPLIGRIRVWINDEELASELSYRHNTPKGLVSYARSEPTILSMPLA